MRRAGDPAGAASDTGTSLDLLETEWGGGGGMNGQHTDLFPTV